MFSRFAIPFCAAALIIGTAETIQGTTIRDVPFDVLCRKAEQVFCGTVIASHTERNAATGAIHTLTTFGRLEWIAGDATAEQYVVRTLGGEVNGERLEVRGMPTFEIDGRYVVFIRGNRRYACPVVGWRQGCFHVVEGEPGTSPTVQAADESDVVGISDGRVQRISAERRNRDTRASMTLDQFVAHVRAARNGSSRTAPEDSQP